MSTSQEGAMNRYPLWKYAILVIAMLVGLIYTAQLLRRSARRAGIERQGDAQAGQRADLAGAAGTRAAGLNPDLVQFDGNSVKARFADVDAQGRAKDALNKALNPDPNDPSYIVALNLVSQSPRWLTALHALPMYLGLDLRGGVHFLMQVDMKAALTKKAEALTGDIRTLLRDKNLRHAGIRRQQRRGALSRRGTLTAAQNLLTDQL
jgi:preprotein translocase subunit SecD